jgi:hypothetical protein
MSDYDSSSGDCHCHYGPDDFKRWIADPEKRVPHEYRTHRETGEYVLACTKCGGLWNSPGHRSVDRVFIRSADDVFRDQ